MGVNERVTEKEREREGEREIVTASYRIMASKREKGQVRESWRERERGQARELQMSCSRGCM